MLASIISGGALHVASSGILLYKLLWQNTCRGVSLYTQELLFFVYICRYTDVLYLFISFWDFSFKLLYLTLSLTSVLLIRYSPQVVATYDADFDTFPRSVLLIPCLVCAVLFNRLALVMELLKTFSNYLESVVLVPQFYLLYQRKQYDKWVLLYMAFLGSERIVFYALPAIASHKLGDFYNLIALAVQLLVLLVGYSFLLVQHIKEKQQQGLNEQEKPAFDEVWEASKFRFEEPEKRNNV